MRQAVADGDLLDLARERGVGVIAYSPLLKGYYGNRTKTLDERFSWEDSDIRIKVLDEVARQIGATAPQVVYAWLLSHRPTVLPIAAASKNEQLREAVNALDIKLSCEQIERLNSAGL